MKKWQLTKRAGLIAAISMVSVTSFAAQISSNLTLTSNYIWRGVSQTDDSAAVQGGVDYTINKHFYTGAWTSNVEGANNVGDYELDVYGGYTNKFGNFDFDAGIITYQYPGNGGIDDFTEIYAGTAYKNYSAKLSIDIAETDMYLEGAADFELPDKYLITAHLGIYNYDRAGFKDYIDYSATISKGDISFMVSNTDLPGDNIRVNISWSKSF